MGKGQSGGGKRTKWTGRSKRERTKHTEGPKSGKTDQLEERDQMGRWMQWTDLYRACSTASNTDPVDWSTDLSNNIA